MQQFQAVGDKEKLTMGKTFEQSPVVISSGAIVLVWLVLYQSVAKDFYP
jgi:hypothetical protein